MKVNVMNLKLKAGVDVLKMIVVCCAVSALTIFIVQTVALATLGYVAFTVFVAYMIYIMYSIRLSQLSYEATVKETIDK